MKFEYTRPAMLPPNDEVRLIVGQTNFFQRFKVTFEAYSETLDISSRS